LQEDVERLLQVAVEMEESAGTARASGNIEAAEHAQAASDAYFEDALTCERTGEYPPGLQFQVGPMHKRLPLPQGVEIKVIKN
jgi:hypothetical protein